MKSSDPWACMSFHLIRSSLTYLRFSSTRVFIPRYFIPLDATGNGIISLISFSSCLLLVHRNITDFYVLILYSETLINSFISSSTVRACTCVRVCVCSSRCSTYTIISLQIEIALPFPLQFGCFLFLFLA